MTDEIQAVAHEFIAKIDSALKVFYHGHFLLTIDCDNQIQRESSYIPVKDGKNNALFFFQRKIVRVIGVPEAMDYTVIIRPNEKPGEELLLSRISGDDQLSIDYFLIDYKTQVCIQFESSYFDSLGRLIRDHPDDSPEFEYLRQVLSKRGISEIRPQTLTRITSQAYPVLDQIIEKMPKNPMPYSFQE